MEMIEKIEKIENVKKELEAMSTEETVKMIKKYYDCIIYDDVDGAFDITMKMYNMFSAETLAWFTYVLTKSEEKISDYYYSHGDDDEFVKKTDEVMTILDKLLNKED